MNNLFQSFLTIVGILISTTAVGFTFGSLPTDTIYLVSQVDQAPVPTIGMSEFNKQMALGMKYPTEYRQQGIEGTILIYFIVDESGQIVDSGIEQKLHRTLDKYALAAFKKVKSDWQAGIKDGVPVKVRMTVPVQLRLDR